ncbi:TOG array regulator of axonemal microtubules protein 1-like [Stegodyphus dumicola]|uniref:TOG array regulator of axonemal microtubules protein 1-like n=1 Tax=Stegodyphus dumicola TaxID=202533 RepID=UPI0015ACDA5F|nr:TOG array regulator of axonemal microtubules protein 1-like [Stegodyphus dumicola]
MRECPAADIETKAVRMLRNRALRNDILKAIGIKEREDSREDYDSCTEDDTSETAPSTANVSLNISTDISLSPSGCSKPTTADSDTCRNSIESILRFETACDSNLQLRNEERIESSLDTTFQDSRTKRESRNSEYNIQEQGDLTSKSQGRLSANCTFSEHTHIDGPSVSTHRTRWTIMNPLESGLIILENSKCDINSQMTHNEKNIGSTDVKLYPGTSKSIQCDSHSLSWTEKTNCPGLSYVSEDGGYWYDSQPTGQQHFNIQVSGGGDANVLIHQARLRTKTAMVREPKHKDTNKDFEPEIQSNKITNCGVEVMNTEQFNFNFMQVEQKKTIEAIKELGKDMETIKEVKRDTEIIEKLSATCLEKETFPDVLSYSTSCLDEDEENSVFGDNANLLEVTSLKYSHAKTDGTEDEDKIYRENKHIRFDIDIDENETAQANNEEEMIGFNDYKMSSISGSLQSLLLQDVDEGKGSDETLTEDIGDIDNSSSLGLETNVLNVCSSPPAEGPSYSEETPFPSKGKELPRTPVPLNENTLPLKSTPEDGTPQQAGALSQRKPKGKKSIENKTAVTGKKKPVVEDRKFQKQTQKKVDDEELLKQTSLVSDANNTAKWAGCQWRRDLEYAAKGGTCPWAEKFEHTVKNMKPFPSNEIADAEMKKTLEDLYGKAWKEKEEAMLIVIRLAKHHPEIVLDNASKIIVAVCNEIKNFRQSVAGKAILTSGYLYSIMGKHIENKLRMVVAVLLAKSGNRTLAAYFRLVIQSLFKIVKYTAPQKCAMAFINEGGKHPNKASRETAAQFLTILTSMMGPENSLTPFMASHVMKCAAMFATDSSALTRHCGKLMFTVLMKHPEFEKLKDHWLDIDTAQDLTKTLESIKTKDSLKSRLEVAAGFVTGETCTSISNTSFRSHDVCGGIAYTCCLRYPHSKRPIGIRSSELGGLSSKPPYLPSGTASLVCLVRRRAVILEPSIPKLKQRQVLNKIGYYVM